MIITTKIDYFCTSLHTMFTIYNALNVNITFNEQKISILKADKIEIPHNMLQSLSINQQIPNFVVKQNDNQSEIIPKQNTLKCEPQTVDLGPEIISDLKSKHKVDPFPPIQKIVNSDRHLYNVDPFSPIQKIVNSDRHLYNNRTTAKEIYNKVDAELCEVRFYNLSQRTNESDITLLCEVFGKVESVKMIRGHTTNKAFVKGNKEFVNKVVANLDERQLDGRTLHVHVLTK